MQRTLQEHIALLEEEVRKARIRLEMHAVDQAERDHLRKRLQLAAIALDSYRRAHELEKKLGSDQPA